VAEQFVFYSLFLWQIGFIIGILLKLFYKPSGKKFVSTVVSNKPTVEVETPKSKPSHIDVEMKKNISLQKAKVSSVKSDEVIKGKVSTQKEKLKQLRRG
tara:strand:- start:605 stop:901 length:297 start_codon:yes stop_codon:yes gene_type:complete